VEREGEDLGVAVGVADSVAGQRVAVVARISDQSPPAGTTVKNGSRVRLWLDRGGGAGVREPRRPRPTPKPARAMRPEPT